MTTMQPIQSTDNDVLSYDNLFNKVVLTRKIGISMAELSSNTEAKFREMMENKLKLDYEGLCLKEGYVKYDSIALLTYSLGIMNGDRFEYSVVFECNVCSPTIGMKVNCLVKNITKAGIRCIVADLPTTASRRIAKTPLVLFVARDHYYNNDRFNTIKEDDIITVDVVGTRYELNDEYIVVFGDLVE